MKVPTSSREQLPGERGQSLVEITLFVPILILLLAGFVEIGVLINGYITTLDASRASARYVSPLDPKVTRCQPFGSDTTSHWIAPFTTICTEGVAEYPSRAAEVREWEIAAPGTVYDTCQSSDTVNFFYVAGCLALLNLPRGGLVPITQTIWTADDYAGDDILVTTIPISNGAPVYDDGLLWWSLYGTQPTPAFPSFVISPTGGSTFQINADFVSSLSRSEGNTAPATGLVVVEVYHAQPQFLKLFNIANRMTRGGAIIPDPIPIHTYTVFPLVAVEP
jgi:hypothetical protein